jgi:hypothetical protein
MRKIRELRTYAYDEDDFDKENQNAARHASNFITNKD